MDDLNYFMRRERLPPPMQRRLREYFHQTRHISQSLAQRRLFELMSPTLQSEVVFTVNESWLLRVWFLERAEWQFVVRLALALQAEDDFLRLFFEVNIDC